MQPASSNVKHLFTVVIASVCDDARAERLKRACESVRAMATGHDYSILVVANGPRVSTGVLAWLHSRPDTRVVRLRTGSHPLARRVGAEMAESEFLAFLDDDDELIPNTLTSKIAHFREHPEVDVLVTDGLRIDGSTTTKVFPPLSARRADLVETLMLAGWSACSLTLRIQNVDLSVLDPDFRHMEWTLTALKLARHHQVGFLDVPTYRYYADTPHSLSKSVEHHLATPELWRRLSRDYAGTRYDAAVRRRYGTACHEAAWGYARQGRMHDAWRFHAESLTCPGGMGYVPFSAKLVLAPVRHIFARSSSNRPSTKIPG